MLIRHLGLQVVFFIRLLTFKSFQFNCRIAYFCDILGAGYLFVAGFR